MLRVFAFSRAYDALFFLNKLICVWTWCGPQVIDTQIEMPIVGAMTLFVSLLTFTLRVHPDRLDYVDQVLVWFPFLSIFSEFLVNIVYVACIYTI